MPIAATVTRTADSWIAHCQLGAAESDSFDGAIRELQAWAWDLGLDVTIVTDANGSDC